jgi:hypothetical protein
MEMKPKIGSLPRCTWGERECARMTANRTSCSQPAREGNEKKSEIIRRIADEDEEEEDIAKWSPPNSNTMMIRTAGPWRRYDCAVIFAHTSSDSRGHSIWLLLVVGLANGCSALNRGPGGFSQGRPFRGK